MTAAIQAPETDAVPCQALHVSEMLVFCPAEWRNKELLICPFLVKNNRLKSMGYDGGYTLTIGIVEEATVLISVIVVGTFHCKFIMFYIDLFLSINNDFHSFFCFKHII